MFFGRKDISQCNLLIINISKKGNTEKKDKSALGWKGLLFFNKSDLPLLNNYQCLPKPGKSNH